MTKENLVALYAGAIILYEHDELMYRTLEAFSKKGSEVGFKIMDIFLFVTFYPIYFLIYEIDEFNSDLADSFFSIFTKIMWVVFSPIYFILILWNRFLD